LQAAVIVAIFPGLSASRMNGAARNAEYAAQSYDVLTRYNMQRRSGSIPKPKMFPYLHFYKEEQ
jgi:hypothetical protein